MYYQQLHRFYCGIDFHARNMFTHLLDARGQTVFVRDLPADSDEFLDTNKPFRKHVMVGCECLFS